MSGRMRWDAINSSEGLSRFTDGRIVRLAVLVLSLLLATDAWAGGTKAFRHTTAKDFDEGEAVGAIVLPTGDVTTGLGATRLPLEAAFVWCGVTSADRTVAYFGTGDQGRIFEVDLGSAGGGPKAPAERSVRKVADLDAAWVTALAARPDGGLLAGATPGGRIFAVDPRSGAARDVVKLPAEHVWSLAYDAKAGITYAGTGPDGKVFAVDRKGKARLFWDSGDRHVVSLALAEDGALLAGTSDQAILYRVRPDGRAEALHDFEAEEVRAIARHGRTIYVAVNDFEKPQVGVMGTVAASPPAKGTKVVVSSGGPPASAGALPRPGGLKAKAAVYRLDPDGRIEQVHVVPDGYFTALLAPGDGGGGSANDVGILAATGTQGKVYRISSDRTVALAVDVPERQALVLVGAGSGDGFLVGTGDVGGIYRASPAGAGGVTYLSKVMDAEYPARWGQLHWRGTTGVAFETRAGNTAKPDASWSGWEKLTGGSVTGDGGAARVASRGSRYLQYRASLISKSVLREVTVYYLPQNQRARVTELTFGDAPAAAVAAIGTTPSGSGPPGAATRAHSPMAKLRWKVDNADGDELSFRLAFREESETVWRPLGGPDALTKPEYDWNTESVPDGTYVVRIVTSDDRVNPRERALDSTYVSAPFLVDNRKPEVAGLEVRYPTIAGRARDSASNITLIELSVDGGDWFQVSPTDGILDDNVEAFSARLPALPAGAHVVTVRAWDAADNVGASQVTVRAP